MKQPRPHLLSLLALLLCILFPAAASAQYVTQAQALWQSQMPGGQRSDGSAPQWEQRKSDGTAFTHVSCPTLERFAPVSGTANGKAVIVCPGGAYQMLAYQKEGQEIAQWLARQGFEAFVLAYRVPNNRQGALEDLQRAIRVVRSQGFPTVGVAGFSAGASLSCRAATNWKQPAYQPINPAVDTLSCRPDFGILVYPAYLDEGPGGTLSPDLFVDADTPPLFVFGTEDDVKYSGPSCKTLLKAMQEAGAPIQLHYLTRGGHGYGMRRGAGLVWPSLAENWLKGLFQQ